MNDLKIYRTEDASAYTEGGDPRHLVFYNGEFGGYREVVDGLFLQSDWVF